MYIVLAKFLAKRLNKVVVKVISNSKNVFVKGRQFFGVVLIANEAINSMLKRYVYEVLCKLDIKKRYDHAN